MDTTAKSSSIKNSNDSSQHLFQVDRQSQFYSGIIIIFL